MTRMFTASALTALALLTAGAARADQLAYFDGETAQRVISELADQTRVVTYCAPCEGDTPTSHPLTTVTLVRMPTTSDDGVQWTVETNLKTAFDLAYVYVWKHGYWTNLGILVGQSPSDVPWRLRDVPAPEGALPEF